jgi:S1-C subfamily serine protease
MEVDRVVNYNDSEYREPKPVNRSAAPALLLAGCLGLVLLAVIWPGKSLLPVRNPVAVARPVVPREDLAEDEKATIELFERCSKSVVYVSPKVWRQVPTFFGYVERPETGTGSGFVWDQRGHIVANYHVVQGVKWSQQESCSVTLPDHSTFRAGLVNAWPDKDIAVLRIDAPREKLVPIDVGMSGDLRVGQKVFAIGNPYAFDFTLTTGVVSALNRQIETFNNRTIQGVIQTDAAINPGNSGGPLLDSAGRLIGMNTSIVSRSGASAGIGFAVPVDVINRIVSQIIAHGKVIRPGLGVVPDDSIPRRLGRRGVLIISVSPGGGAERAGLRPTMIERDGDIILGDIITSVGDTPTPDTDALLHALEQYQIGQTVEVTVDRDGRRKTVSVTLQAIE